MSSPIDIPIEILKQVAALLRRLTPEEIESLINGQAKLICEPLVKRGQVKKSPALEVSDIEEIGAALAGMHSREAGHSYLEELGLNREKLRQLTSALDLPMPRSDTVEKVKDRIIEATIGYRIRSEAIRGKGSDTGDGDLSRQPER